MEPRLAVFINNIRNYRRVAVIELKPGMHGSHWVPGQQGQWWLIVPVNRVKAAVRMI